MNYIGIDIGTSNIKIIEVDEKLDLKNKMIFEGKNVKESFDKFINCSNIDLKHVKQITATGVGANKLREKIENVDIEIVPEFEAIANGGKLVVKNDNFIAVSIGTGTAFVKNKDKSIAHIGGTGIGGGTLLNLCKKIDPNFTFDKIEKITKTCNLEDVDLWIKDVTDEEIKTLPKNITAVNFGKLTEKTNNEDMILGFINMVFEAVGVMAAFAAKGEGINKIAIFGQLAKIPFARKVLDKIEILHDVKFAIAKNPEYMVALGAIYTILHK